MAPPQPELPCAPGFINALEGLLTAEVGQQVTPLRRAALECFIKGLIPLPCYAAAGSVIALGDVEVYLEGLQMREDQAATILPSP